jgi:hypothetical protein
VSGGVTTWVRVQVGRAVALAGGGKAFHGHELVSTKDLIDSIGGFELIEGFESIGGFEGIVNDGGGKKVRVWMGMCVGRRISI